MTHITRSITVQGLTPVLRLQKLLQQSRNMYKIAKTRPAYTDIITRDPNILNSRRNRK